MTREKIIDRLKNKISDKRLEHSFGVEYTAACLAMVHNTDVEKARIAGLLHDCAKGIPTREKLEKAKKYGLPVNRFEEKNPDILHGKLGAYYARCKYGIEDADILNAITYHTTGRPGMSELEKIIFIADYIEPNRRPLPNIDVIRRTAFSDIDECLLMILRGTLDYLENTSAEIDIMTEKTYRYYMEEI